MYILKIQEKAHHRNRSKLMGRSLRIYQVTVFYNLLKKGMVQYYKIYIIAIFISGSYFIAAILKPFCYRSIGNCTLLLAPA